MVAADAASLSCIRIVHIRSAGEDRVSESSERQTSRATRMILPPELE
ncbi:hypothetical protein KZ483_02210 [Paenibacillus sp. sptzw28]|nr:hypothetical protein [Paenibacillus sp. sptzw28]QYR21876.1 hypothetical protein KZ483_02210 [Paenibacillus sp. sptzw28]